MLDPTTTSDKALGRQEVKKTTCYMCATLFFSCFTQASTNSKIIETGKISMTGNRQTETDRPQKNTQGFSEKIIVTNPIVLTGSRKTSP